MKITLPRRIELLHRSSQRLMEAIKLPRDKYTWAFLRKEISLHLWSTLRTWWAIFLRNEGGDATEK